MARGAWAGHGGFRPLRRPARDSGSQAGVRGVLDGGRHPSRRDHYPERQPAHSAIERSAAADQPTRRSFAKSLAAVPCMTNCVVYMVGMVLRVGALAYGASLLGLSGTWIAV